MYISITRDMVILVVRSSVGLARPAISTWSQPRNHSDLLEQTTVQRSVALNKPRILNDVGRASHTNLLIWRLGPVDSPSGVRRVKRH